MPAATSSASCAPHSDVGGIGWFARNTSSGSTSAFTSRSRRYVSGPVEARRVGRVLLEVQVAARQVRPEGAVAMEVATGDGHSLRVGRHADQK